MSSQNASARVLHSSVSTFRNSSADRTRETLVDTCVPSSAPPEAVSTAQKERPSNRRARETCSSETFQHAVSALRSTEFSPVEKLGSSLPIKFRASEFLTILRRTSPGGLPGHRPRSFCQLAQPTLAESTLGIFPTLASCGRPTLARPTAARISVLVFWQSCHLLHSSSFHPVFPTLKTWHPKT